MHRTILRRHAAHLRRLDPPTPITSSRRRGEQTQSRPPRPPAPDPFLSLQCWSASKACPIHSLNVPGPVPTAPALAPTSPALPGRSTSSESASTPARLFQLFLYEGNHFLNTVLLRTPKSRKTDQMEAALGEPEWPPHLAFPSPPRRPSLEPPRESPSQSKTSSPSSWQSPSASGPCPGAVAHQPSRLPSPRAQGLFGPHQISAWASSTPGRFRPPGILRAGGSLGYTVGASASSAHSSGPPRRPPPSCSFPDRRPRAPSARDSDLQNIASFALPGPSWLFLPWSSSAPHPTRRVRSRSARPKLLGLRPGPGQGPLLLPAPPTPSTLTLSAALPTSGSQLTWHWGGSLPPLPAPPRCQSSAAGPRAWQRT